MYNQRRWKTISEIKEDSEIAPSPGRVRPTQLITSNSPGAIVQAKEDSVLIMGINFWGHRREYIKKHHLYLQKITKKNHFRMPHSTETSSRTIACTSFPRWGFCKYCPWLQFHKEYPRTEDGFFCRDHPRASLLPARLAIVCKKGHLDDFPWVEWAHSNSKNPVPICDNPKIKWAGGKQSSSISNYLLVCETCDAKNSMYGALAKEGIELYDAQKKQFYTYSCTGEIPWLQKQEQCKKTLKDGQQDNESTETAIGIVARAQSLHYPKTIKGIIIPELAHPIVKYLQSDECKIKINAWREADIDNDETIAGLILKGNADFLSQEFTKEDILDLYGFSPIVCTSTPNTMSLIVELPTNTAS